MALIALVFLGVLVACGKQEQKIDLSGYKIVVDPGHGDSDVGTIGVSTGRYEKEVNLEISLRLKNALEQAGATVIMTRESDEPIAAEDETDLAKRKEADMQERERIIEQANADMYLGIHQNSFESAEAAGPQVFYYTGSPEGEKLASCLQNALNEILEPQEPRTVNCGRYRLLKPGNQPSVTIECGFFTNPEEEQKLQTEEYQNRIVEGILKGIYNYITG
jgi:N-acetylmuramoyl-L-alanine amidase